MEVQRSSHKYQVTAQLLQENHPLASVALSEDDQNGPSSDASSQFPHRLTERFFAMAQQLPWHIFSRIIPRHFVKFNHSGTTTLATTNWFCDSSKNLLLLFLFNLSGHKCVKVRGRPTFLRLRMGSDAQ